MPLGLHISRSAHSEGPGNTFCGLRYNWRNIQRRHVPPLLCTHASVWNAAYPFKILHSLSMQHAPRQARQEQCTAA